MKAHDAPTVNSSLHALSGREAEHSDISYRIQKQAFLMQAPLLRARLTAEQGLLSMHKVSTFFPKSPRQAGQVCAGLHAALKASVPARRRVRHIYIEG